MQLKAIGVDNIVRFDFVSPPPPDHIRVALQVLYPLIQVSIFILEQLLYSLKALDDYGRLTLPFGANLAEAPLDPMLSACVRTLRVTFESVLTDVAPILAQVSMFRGNAHYCRDAFRPGRLYF